MTTVPLSQADLLALLKRTSDPTWLSGILSTPDGQAIANAWTAVWEAASIAISKQVDASMISTAPAGSPGVCTLVLSRADATASGVIPQGYTFVSNLGVQLVVAMTVTVSSGQATVALPLVTLRQTDLVNTSEPAFDDLLDPGDYVDAILGSANPACSFFDLGHGAGVLTYVSSTPIVGAIEDWLSAHGDERGCKRQDGEDAENYRARVRAIPDAVSPNAVARALDGCSALLPERWLVEPFLDGADPAARLALQLGFADSPSCDGSFCDDWLGEPLAAKQPLATCECVGLRESRAYVRVDLVGELQDPDGMVLSCDDEGYCDDENWGYPDIGDHPAISSALQALLQELRSKIAGGVQTDVYLDDLEYLQASQEIVMGSPGIAMILDLTPPAGQFWLLKEGLLTAFPLNPADLSTQTIALGLMFADSSTLLTPWMPGDFPLRTFELEKIGYHGQQVVEIVALLQSSVPADVYCAGNFAVISGTL